MTLTDTTASYHHSLGNTHVREQTLESTPEPDLYLHPFTLIYLAVDFN